MKNEKWKAQNKFVRFVVKKASLLPSFQGGAGGRLFPSQGAAHPQNKCSGCFNCFGCFRCFISLLDHKTARFWSKSEQDQKKRYSPTSAIKWVRKTPKKAIHPLVYEHGSVLQAIGAVFSAKPTFCSLPSIPHIPPKPHQIKQPLSKIAVNERAVSPDSFILHHCGHNER